MQKAKPEFTRNLLASLFVLVISFFVISFGINETGQTWDEIAYYNGGKYFTQSFQNRDFSPQAWSANKEHPPLAKYLYALVSKKAYDQEILNFTPGRYLSAFFLSFAVALAFILITGLFSLEIGIFTSLVLMLSPLFIAYGRILGMDSLSILLFSATAFSYLVFAKSTGRIVDYVAPALLTGGCFLTRYNLPLVLPLLPLAIVLFAQKKDILRRFWSLIFVPAIALVIFYLGWPYLWHDPIGAMQTSLGHWGQVKEYYLGQSNAILPNSYFLVYYLLTTPAVVLVLFIVGLIQKFDRNKIYFFAWLILPFINSFIGLKQGGIRYLLFVWIPLALFAALGLKSILNLVKNRALKILLILAFAIYLVFQVVSTYPYYLDYFNEFVGGPSGVYQKKLMSLGWWGEGGERSAKYLNENAALSSKIWLNIKPGHTFGDLRDDLEKVEESDNPDYIVVNTAWKWSSSYMFPSNFEIIHEEKVSGAPIMTILKKK